MHPGRRPSSNTAAATSGAGAGSSEGAPAGTQPQLGAAKRGAAEPERQQAERERLAEIEQELIQPSLLDVVEEDLEREGSAGAAQQAQQTQQAQQAQLPSRAAQQAQQQDGAQHGAVQRQTSSRRGFGRTVLEEPGGEGGGGGSGGAAAG